MLRPNFLETEYVIPPKTLKRWEIEYAVDRARESNIYLQLLKEEMDGFFSPDAIPAICFQDVKTLKLIRVRSRKQLGGYGLRREQIDRLVEEPLDSLASAINGLLNNEGRLNMPLYPRCGTEFA